MSANKKTSTVVGLALLTAVVVVLQVLAVLIRPSGIFTISLVLIPIVVGASLYGWKAGAWLGFVFGVVVLINDAQAFLAISVVGTVLTVIVKGILSGIAAGAVYRLISKKNEIAATVAAAVVCPIVNTGVFLIGCKIFFMDTINSWAQTAGYDNAGAYVIMVLVGINFLIEMGINIVLSPVIVRLVNIRKNKRIK